ncbi:alpha/beta fold hydrolase [Propionibacteriaceae bacterium Y2011]
MSLIRTRSTDGRAHVVGLSLGGLVAVQLIHRHPDLVRTCTISGAAATGYAWWERLVIGVQVPLWHRHWYWAAQAAAFRIPADARDLFAATAAAASPESNRRMFREVIAGAMPVGDFRYTGPLLAVAAQHDVASIHRAFGPLRDRLPQLLTWQAAGVHHPWNVEDPELFTRMVRTHAETATWPDARA